jgi:NAD(P)-dependent dehydrogenase (short-subunit alcohol dehydrogenase family)
MSEALRGKTALITGAARRIGREIALALAREGVHIAVHYQRSHQDALALEGELHGFGVRVALVRGDLSDTEAPGQIFRAATNSLGPIDLLINNASVFPEERLSEMRWDTLEQSIRVHAWAPFVLARFLHESGRPGCVINLLDARVHAHDPLHAPYQLGKRMLSDLTGLMARAFAPRVRVNAIAPGAVLPPEGKGDDYLARIGADMPLRRVPAAEEIAEAAVFLLRAPSITGETLYVDAGRHLKEEGHA